MKRFNPPPTWPAPPAGWTPPDDWTPDPSWGPAPTGWQLWVDDEDRPAASARAIPPARSDAARSTFVVVAAVAAVVILIVGAGVAYWGYSVWKANRIVADIFNPDGGSDLRGTWTGNNKGECDISLVISSSSKLDGTINYCDGRCIESWTETSRTYATIFVEEKVVSGSGCTGVEWKVVIQGNTMTGTKNWESGTGSTDELVLHKSV